MSINGYHLTAVKQAHPRDRIRLIVDWRDAIFENANTMSYGRYANAGDLHVALYKLIGDCVHALEYWGSPSAERAVQDRLREIEQLPAMREEE